MSSSNIDKVAVIGSGVMGSAIAAHIANSGKQVALLDIVPKDAKDRNMLANNAIDNLKKTKPAAFTHKNNVKLVTTGNLEDDLDLLSDADWIIEVVIEDLQIKRDLYKKINTVRKPKSIVSSNTSTIPLNQLVEDMPIEFKKHFLITHFFNPPRYMRLLEVVLGEETNEGTNKIIKDFAEIYLGKTVVYCKDTPGFIANRIGVFWLMSGLLEAMELGITVQEADLVMSRPVGIPKTGVFGLMDLIGIDLLPLIAKEFKATLPESDAFIKSYKEPKLIKNMLADGYNGRKGKGGFYRLNKSDDGKKTKEAIDLKTGEYSTAIKTKLESVDSAKKSLRNLIEHKDIGGQYAKSVLLKLLHYVTSLTYEIADEVTSIDEAMRLGYNWKYGPFELIDRLKDKETGESGAKWLKEKFAEAGFDIPKILEDIGDNDFYKIENGRKLFWASSNSYEEIKLDPSALMLSDIKIAKEPILKNPSACLWDIGNGIACLEYTSKMNSVDPMILEMIEKTTKFISESDHYKGLVIANDSDNFCVGANIGILLFAANVAAWKDIRKIIKQGQDAYMGLKFANFPVVTAVSGMALGGGCEILLHSDAVQAHVETYTGLVEVGVGIIPGWGGCKEMLLRNVEARDNEQSAVAKMGKMFSLLGAVKSLNTMPAISKAFENIAMAKVSTSAKEAQDMLILQEKDAITMNRRRLLCDAKAKCQELSINYQPPTPKEINLPGKSAETALKMAINSFVKSGKATKHDEVVSKALAKVLSGGDTSISKSLSEQDLLDLELDIFMELVREKGTLDRLDHMLETGKPLRN